MDDSERLARFEAVLAALKDVGWSRASLNQQLTARKLALKSMLGAFEEQGLL